MNNIDCCWNEMCSFILFITYNFLISMPSHIHIRLLRTVALCLYQQLPVREVLSVWSWTLNPCWMVGSGATAKVAVAVVTASDLGPARGEARRRLTSVSPALLTYVQYAQPKSWQPNANTLGRRACSTACQAEGLKADRSSYHQPTMLVVVLRAPGL
jgi:hypothetical protein